MTHSISFQPTAQDLLAAYRLNFITSLRSKRAIRTYIIGATIITLLAAAAAWIWCLAPIGWAALVGLGYWAAFVSLTLLANYLRLPRRTRRIFAQQKSLHDNVTVAWSESGISFTVSRGHAHFAWPDFTRIIKGKDVILLHQSDALMNFIPTRVLTAEQIDDLMQAARAS